MCLPAASTLCGACGSGSATATPHDAGFEDSSEEVLVCFDADVNCNGTCVGTSDDPSNCGSCGHDCQDGACVNGQCQPVTLASAQVQPWGLAINEVNVYWTTTSGSVLSCAKTGCGTGPTTIASGQLTPIGIAVDDTNVYWTNNKGGTVAFCPLDGCDGEPTTLASGQLNPRGIAVDDVNVYWTNYASPGEVAGCSKSGCSGAPTVLASNQASPLGIVAGAGFLYWTNNTIPGTTMSCATSGCADQPTQIAVSLGADGIAANASDIYWVEQGQMPGQPDGLLRSCQLPGCTVVGTIGAGLTDPRGVALDPGTAFFTSFAGNAVLKCPLSGTSCTPVVLSSVESSPYAIAVDETAVYWTNRGDNTIRKMAK